MNLDEIFYKKIEQYNELSDFSDKIIVIGSIAMHIYFKSVWKYKIYSVDTL